jgi:hypothetical protein
MFTQLSLGQPKSRQDRVRGDAPEPEGRARAEQAEGEQAGSQLVRWGQEVEAGLRTGEEGEQVREERVKAQGRHIEELVVENERIASEVERTLGENRAAEGSLAATREEAGLMQEQLVVARRQLQELGAGRAAAVAVEEDRARQLGGMGQRSSKVEQNYPDLEPSPMMAICPICPGVHRVGR